MLDRRALLALIADTLVAPVEPGDADAETAAFLRRSASDLGLAELVDDASTARYERVLAALIEGGFAGLDLEGRTRMLRELGERGGETRQLLRELQGAIFGLFYSLPDRDGGNPSWPALGYPGPASPPPSPERAPKTIPVERLAGPRTTLSADVCVVGSGAGGSVIAAEHENVTR